MPSYALYMTSYPHFMTTTLSIHDIICTIWHVIYCVWYPIHYMCDVTQCLYLWHYTVYVMTYPLYMASHIVLWKHNHCATSQPLCLTSPHCINFIKPSVWMTSQPLYVWHYMHYICHHINSLGHHTTLYMPQVHYIWPHVSVYVSSHPNYQWYHRQYIYDITSSITVTSYPLYLWHNIQ